MCPFHIDVSLSPSLPSSLPSFLSLPPPSLSPHSLSLSLSQINTYLFYLTFPHSHIHTHNAQGSIIRTIIYFFNPHPRIYIFFFHLPLDREGGSEGETHQLVASHTTRPGPRTEPQPKYVPLSRIKPTTPWSAGQCSNC
uniref:Uncharacterized protein n=1 Tax=Molossus molossus TaxID=27622 RepID=A0A7J8HBS9_MOLMO|nr:hypothetical protein HJG59_011100 [Molossus molossus]